MTATAAHGTASRGRMSSARSVGSFIPRLTRKVFEKYGFSAATLITDWAVIVGPELARWTQPERLKWPRTAGPDTGEGDTRRASATLILRVEPARALDVQYRQRQITDRINAYFGYRAIGDLRIVQAPLETDIPSRPRALSKENARPPSPPDLSRIGDDSLRAALARLHASLSRE